jgi:hypothetical protein
MSDDYDEDGIDPADLWDEDGWQSYKDGVATGLLNEDGSQREPDPPEDYLDSRAEQEWQLHLAHDHAGGECDCAAEDPWATDPESLAQEAPF